MARRRDFLVDKKIGSVIRMQRVKLGISQAELEQIPLDFTHSLRA